MTIEKFSVLLSKPKHLSAACIETFSVSDGDMSVITAVLQKATQTNLAQTQPIGNMKSLGKSTNKLAKQVISFT